MKKKKPQKINKKIAATVAMVGIAGLTVIRPDVPNGVLDRDYINVSEAHDGYTHAVFIDTPYLSYSTASNISERSPHTAGWYATWQRLTAKGWQIILYNAENNKAYQLTDIQGDQIDPHTDGRYVVWQGKGTGKWEVYLFDTQNPDWGIRKISTTSPATHPRVSDGVAVWQQWVDNDWEIMSWTEDRTTMLTDNQKPDIEPDIFHSMLVWTQTNPGPRHKILVRDLQRGDESYLEADSAGQIRPSFRRDGTLEWYAFTDEGYVRRYYNFLTDIERTDIVKKAQETEYTLPTKSPPEANKDAETVIIPQTEQSQPEERQNVSPESEVQASPDAQDQSSGTEQWNSQQDSESAPEQHQENLNQQPPTLEI